MRICLFRRQQQSLEQRAQRLRSREALFTCLVCNLFYHCSGFYCCLLKHAHSQLVHSSCLHCSGLYYCLLKRNTLSSSLQLLPSLLRILLLPPWKEHIIIRSAVLALAAHGSVAASLYFIATSLKAQYRHGHWSRKSASQSADDRSNEAQAAVHTAIERNLDAADEVLPMHGFLCKLTCPPNGSTTPVWPQLWAWARSLVSKTHGNRLVSTYLQLAH